MVAACARVGQTAKAVGLSRCGRLTTLLDALVNNPSRVPTCRWKKNVGSGPVVRLTGGYPASTVGSVLISRLVERNGPQLRFQIPLIEVLESTDSILASIAAIAEARLRWYSATENCEGSMTPTLHLLLATAPRQHRSECRQKR
jgi:hypothetical protein